MQVDMEGRGCWPVGLLSCDLRSELPQRVAAPQLEALIGLITETLQRVEVITVNLLVVPIGKRYFNPGAMAPLIYAALYLEEAQLVFNIFFH